ncbi:MAG TPA: serine hydrolase domain-containing protein, partial [Cytophagales bacterium]|nr:serine hydrolase domain-containing protein [Cytophagales bacterium]
MNRKYQHKVLLSMICAIVAACHKSEPLSPASYSCHPIANDSSHNHPHHQKYTHLLSELTQKGVPGITMSIHTPQGGTWIGAAGKADLYNKIAFQPCNITRVGSTVKMFTATTILILAEEGKVKLSDPISKYLPQTVLSTLKNANQSTIQQLLNHSSGIYNYIQNLQFQTGSLNDLPKIWQPEELLAYAQNKPAYFAPGSDSKYSNTNYILLGMLIEALEKKPFFKVFKEKLFKPLGLQYTRFAAEDPIPPGLVKGYIDLYGKLQLTESTYYSGWDYYTADGGLISTPYDLMQFLRALMDGKIISQENLDTMLTWN